jgi:hypothetical protein
MDEPSAATLRDRLPALAPDELERALALAQPRRPGPPLGSAEAEAIALRNGWKPVLREMLDESQLDARRAAFEREGFETSLGQRFVTHAAGRIDRSGTRKADGGTERVVLFVGRDENALREAAQLERDATLNDRRLGELLGYPRCCVDAFVGTPRPRTAMQLLRAAQRRTVGLGDALLDVADLRAFHFVPWTPCTFRCAPSIEYAARIDAWLGRHHPEFARDVRVRLRATRLVLHADVQIAIRGHWESDVFVVERAVPASQFHPPNVRLPPESYEATARLLVALQRAGSLRRLDDTLAIDGLDPRALERALLLEFE